MRVFRWLIPLTALAALLVIVIPARAATSDSWQENLAAASGVNIRMTAKGVRVADPAVRLGAVTRSSGLLVTSEHGLTSPADTVRAVVTGTGVSVEVRGRDSTGRWTEWVPADGGVPARLPVPMSAVQVRLTLAATGAVTGLAVTATRERATAVAAPAVAVSYRVYATREGLVGGRTANGHIIANRDHFVALPSRRGLNATSNGRGYLVQVCYARSGRCETAPVWDVGPWNVTDDYWNPSSVRQSWRDLAQGMPEAQAARLNGYNGGRDGFGRTVLNPAGIDLGDGTFWDGLGMTGNDWVTVSYLWT